MAHVCANTGWTWDYVEWQLDVPRLAALSAQWRQLPPPALQLARIARFLGLEVSVAASSPAAESPERPQDETDLIDLFGTGPPLKVMSPEEYLAKRYAGV
jgi:hypothetical protein